MKQKDTDKLLELLRRAGNIDSYLNDNADFLLDCTLKEYLNALIQEKKLTIAQISRNANLNDAYCYQFLSPSNPRNPSREVLLSLCIGMHLNLDETQLALKIAKYAALYPKDERDSMIIFGIETSQSLVEINTTLYDHGFKCLCEK
ncbi:MAG: hypothetical protein IJY85_06345 [Ruminococcus sp.]|nr:hypothetical protein [Ruminococcus sp.]